MNRYLRTPRFLIFALMGLLAGCGGAADSGSSPQQSSSVSVTTVMPQQQTFHDSIEAIGCTMGDPHRARTLSLAYGGQIVEVKVAAGETVHGGDVLLTIRADPATRSAFQQAQSALTLAQGELQRTGKLAAERLATQSQVAAARKSLSDAQAALDAQKAIGGGAAQQVVNAPADGVVTALRVGLGDRVSANAPLLDFTPAHALVAQVGVQPESGSKLHAGMPVELHSVYGPPQGFTGTLRMIGQSVDPQTHLLPAQVELPASVGSQLVAGAAVTAQIHAADFKAWAVPRDAVLNDDQGDFLFQVQNGHAKRVKVTLRSADGATVGVLGALDAQAPIIVLGVYELGDGDAVQTSAQSTDATRPAPAKSAGVASAQPARASSTK